MFYVYYSCRLLKRFVFFFGGAWPPFPLLPFVSCHPDSMLIVMALPLASATASVAFGLLLSWPCHPGRGGKDSTVVSSAPGGRPLVHGCSGPVEDALAQGAPGRQWRERMLSVPWAWDGCLWNSGIHLIFPFSDHNRLWQWNNLSWVQGCMPAKQTLLSHNQHRSNAIH